MATSLEESKREVRIIHIHPSTNRFVKKMVKIGPVDPEIIVLKFKIKVKNKEINTSKI